MGLIPGQGTKMPYAVRNGQNKQTKKIGKEGNFLNTIENLSETNNEITIVRLPGVHVEDINEGFI